jgi:hypothetical protein
MMQPNGTIEYDHDNAWHPSPDRTVFPLVWRGGPIARISHQILYRESGIRHYPVAGEVVHLRMWRIRVIESDYSGYLIVMADGWQARVRVPLAKLDRFWRQIKARIIVTFGVWGLANWDWGLEPSWSDIHLVAWIKRKVKR